MGKAISLKFLSGIVNGIVINSSIQCNFSNYNECVSRKVDYIVIHYTGNSKDIAVNNCRYFQGAGRKASAHFFCDDSNIYQSVALKDAAWHCGCSSGYKTECRNTNSIGIEMCCTAGNYRVSDTTIKNAAHLCAHLCKQINISADMVDRYVLRHYDVVATNKRCPAQFVSEPKQWEDFKKMVKDILNGESTSSETPVASSSSAVFYRVYSGSFSLLERAEERIAKLNGVGFRAIIKPYGKMYRVQVAACNEKKNADDIMARLKNIGFSCFVIRE